MGVVPGQSQFSGKATASKLSTFFYGATRSNRDSPSPDAYATQSIDPKRHPLSTFVYPFAASPLSAKATL
jgi:hypothetical protein